ncbi:phosphoribosylpyrophosphate synthetase [Hymenobacter sediminicola]|uniref:Phosphoribosylpyrophosphate synthetase n=1 Tax=Hymenobacter sediminicola TaxID=2761579 RepID=A0A7G7W9T6_9BACT|nr:phosphoribosylpyrophosphate synthetase [Hymenobacter sediminicola]QNH63129.1 phosphoribosylpyrophosphate synthetase [Hymenobacter sediminicola]
MSLYSYDTLSEAMHDLQQRGYDQDFNLTNDYLHCPGLDLELYPQHFQVREVYRFEGETDPGDENVLYAIESNQGVKGLLVSAFGAYSEPINDELMHKLNMPQA